MYHKYAEETRNIEQDMLRKGPMQGTSTHFEIKSKSKAHKALT